MMIMMMIMMIMMLIMMTVCSNKYPTLLATCRASGREGGSSHWMPLLFVLLLVVLLLMVLSSLSPAVLLPPWALVFFSESFCRRINRLSKAASRISQLSLLYLGNKGTVPRYVRTLGFSLLNLYGPWSNVFKMVSFLRFLRGFEIFERHPVS